VTAAVRTALALAALTIVCAPLRAQHASPGALQVVGRADYSWPLRTLDNRRATLGDFRGRVLVINSWATWCEPCVAELQSLTALRRAVPDTNVVFLLVAPQRREPVEQFVRRRGLTLPVYLEAAAPPAAFAFEAVPTTWIVDRQGNIVLRHRGAARWDLPATIAFLDALREH
jgi:thiol-disulfide isomerase/thioredoxin